MPPTSPQGPVNCPRNSSLTWMHSSSPISGSSTHWRSDYDVLLHKVQKLQQRNVVLSIFFCPIPRKQTDIVVMSTTLSAVYPSEPRKWSQIERRRAQFARFLGFFGCHPDLLFTRTDFGKLPLIRTTSSRMTHFPAVHHRHMKCEGKRSSADELTGATFCPDRRQILLWLRCSGGKQSCAPLSFRTVRTQLIWHLALMAPGCPWRCSLAA